MIRLTVKNISRTCRRLHSKAARHDRKDAPLKKKLDTYLAAFGAGTPSDFSSMEHYFEDIYHTDFQLTEEDGSVYSREPLRQCHAYFFAVGCTAKLIRFEHLSSDKVEIKYNVINGDNIIYIHSLATVKDNQIIEKKPFDRSLQHHRNGHYLRELRRG